MKYQAEIKIRSMRPIVDDDLIRESVKMLIDRMPMYEIHRVFGITTECNAIKEPGRFGYSTTYTAEIDVPEICGETVRLKLTRIKD